MNRAVQTNTEVQSDRGIYESYFGFTESPFSLTPDPKYLFLSQKHKEALAHLSYGVQQRKGFVAVFGEVGTGKTTLCRAFLDTLDSENYEVALIYNPALTDIEFLWAINTEFKIDATQESKYTLISQLNHFLLEANQQGKNVVLIIDEAQALDFRVLEQIRLISNLETETDKLMQIVLIGQLELEDILTQHKLRQLNQRIMVRSYLKPLDLDETIKYIEHRLRIAGGSKDVEKLFTRRAYRTLHRYTNGVPRLINVLADRVLLVAYSLNKRKVTNRIVRKAIDDLENVDRQAVRQRSMKRVAAFIWILFLLSMGWQFRDRMGDTVFGLLERTPKLQRPSEQLAVRTEAKGKEKLTQDAPTETMVTQDTSTTPTHAPTETMVTQDIPTPPPSDINSLLQFLVPLSADETKIKAIEAILGLWGLSASVDPALKFNIIVPSLGMRVYQYDGNLRGIKALNYPAILELHFPQETMAKYVALKHVRGDQGTFSLSNDTTIPLSAIDDLWYGRAYIFWKDFQDLSTRLRYGDQSTEVAWIQKKLKSLGYYDDDTSSTYSTYDEKTKIAVTDFQGNHHIRTDGIVGPETKMILYDRLTRYNTPNLMLDVEEEPQ